MRRRTHGRPSRPPSACQGPAFNVIFVPGFLYCIRSRPAAVRRPRAVGLDDSGRFSYFGIKRGAVVRRMLPRPRDLRSISEPMVVFQRITLVATFNYYCHEGFAVLTSLQICFPAL